jgi:hypothetical protein
MKNSEKLIRKNGNRLATLYELLSIITGREPSFFLMVLSVITERNVTLDNMFFQPQILLPSLPGQDLIRMLVRLRTGTRVQFGPFE